MHRKSPEEEALLSSLIALFCVYETPLSGYGVRAKLKEWNIREHVTISPATIYRALAKLEDAGFLNSRIERKGRYPASRLYRITPAGRKHYRDLIKQMATFSRTSYSLAPLIGLGSFMPATQRVKLAEQWVVDATVAKTELESRVEDRTIGVTYGKPFAEWLLLSHEIARLRANITWMKRYIKLLQAGKA
jgi:DNA-binding PadR family transcriptional regulator